MIGQGLHRLWIDVKTDAQRFWFHLKNVLSHPWDSLVALVAAVGAFVIAIPRYIGKLPAVAVAPDQAPRDRQPARDGAISAFSLP